MKVSLIIPNWNGRKLLEKNFPKVMEAAKLPENKAVEIIVVDDGSTDKSVEYIRNISLKVKIIENKLNRGFIYSCNRGIGEAKGEIVVLLNNDVVPEKSFLKYALPHFNDSSVFSVSFCEPNWSWAKIEWKNGFIGHSPGVKAKTAHISGWASGGSAVFRKSIWEALGGFDPLFAPFYWEDLDISYRARKRGYKIFWEPRAIVHHEHEGTISRFSSTYVRMISERNQLLFIWKNISDPKMILEHKIYLGKRLLVHPGYSRPFLAALAKLPQVLPRWFKEWKEKTVSDKEIFAQFR